MKHKTLNILFIIIIALSNILSYEWPNLNKKIYKEYSFNNYHRTYKILSDSLYYIISNTSNENHSKNYSTIISVDSKGELKQKLELNNTNNHILSGIKLKNDGFLFVGHNRSHNDEWNKIYVVKTDKDLNIIWQKNYGSDNYENKGYSIIELNENEYCILGYTKASKNNALILKIDNYGNEKWFSYLPNLKCSFASHMIINKQKEIILAGQLDKQLFVSKIDKNGNILWNYNYLNDNHYHRLFDIKNTNDNGIIMVGNTTKNFKKKKDILIIKLSNNGIEEWVQTLGNKDSEAAYDIEEINSNYAVAGFAVKNKKGTLYNSFIIKIDSLGKQLSRIDLNNLNSNKIYDINIDYNKKTNTNLYIGVGDIENDNKSKILFISFEEK